MSRLRLLERDRRRLILDRVDRVLRRRGDLLAARAVELDVVVAVLGDLEAAGQRCRRPARRAPTACRDRAASAPAGVAIVGVDAGRALRCRASAATSPPDFDLLRRQARVGREDVLELERRRRPAARRPSSCRSATSRRRLRRSTSIGFLTSNSMPSNVAASPVDDERHPLELCPRRRRCTISATSFDRNPASFGRRPTGRSPSARSRRRA